MFDVQTLEESTFRAWPALEMERYDGWVMRFANGYTGRSNSVTALYPSTLNLDAKIDYCDAWFHARNLPPRFRLVQAAHTDAVDSALERRGYTKYSESVVMALELARLPTVQTIQDASAILTPDYSDKWVASFCQFNTAQTAHEPTIRQLLSTMALPHWFASVEYQGERAAVGLLVRDGDLAALFDIAARADLRGRGIGKLLIRSLLERAQAEGVQTIYLQALASNEPAIRLYSGFGFQTLYPYWYRIPG